MRDYRIAYRLVAAAAVAIVSAGTAAAQSTTEAAPGHPISLLQILQSATTADPPKKQAVDTASVHPRKTSSVARHHHVAARRTHHAARLVQDDKPAGDAATTPVDASAAGNSVAVDPSALVIDGRTVEVAGPTEFTAMDRAAGDTDMAPDVLLKSEFDQLQAQTANGAPPAGVLAPHPAQTGEAATGAAPAAVDDEKTPHVSWFTQVLAALGGAIAAGSAGWLLVGATTPRT